MVANEEAIKIPAKNDIRIERFGNDGGYPKRKRRLPGEWWKNHILPQQGEERANLTLLDNPLNLCKTSRSKHANKWEAQCKRSTTRSWSTIRGNLPTF